MRPPSLKRCLALAAATTGLAATIAPPALATFPGQDGRIGVVVDRAVSLGGFLGFEIDSQVVSVAPDGTDRKAANIRGARDARVPGYSPDGKRLVVRATRNSGSTYVGPAEGPLRTQVYAREPGKWPRRVVGADASWTPDGKFVFSGGGYDGDPGKFYGRFTRWQGTWRPLVEIYQAPSERGLDSLRDSALSPDGKTIAFLIAVRVGDNIRGRLWLVNSDGSSPRQLPKATTELTIDDGIDWSPDGTQLVTTASGGNLIILSATDGAEKVLDIRGRHAKFSPSGTRLAYLDFPTPKTSLYVANVDGSNPTAILKNTVPFSDGIPGLIEEFEGVSWQARP